MKALMLTVCWSALLMLCFLIFLALLGMTHDARQCAKRGGEWQYEARVCEVHK